MIWLRLYKNTMLLLVLVLTLLYTSSICRADSCTNFVVGGGFEQGYSPSSWIQVSPNFSTPLCLPHDCPIPSDDNILKTLTFLQRSGSWWAWFQPGPFFLEQASLEQSITISPGVAQLRLYVWLEKLTTSGTNFLRVTVNGKELFKIAATDPAYTTTYLFGPRYPVYVPVIIDLSEYADSTPYSLRIESTVENTSYFVDDVNRYDNENYINIVPMQGTNPVKSKIAYNNNQPNKSNLLLQTVIDAIDTSYDSQEIRAREFIGSEDIHVTNVPNGKVLKLRGGFNCDMSENFPSNLAVNWTSVKSLSVSQGTVIAQKLKIRTPPLTPGGGLVIKGTGRFVPEGVIISPP